MDISFQVSIKGKPITIVLSHANGAGGVLHHIMIEKDYYGVVNFVNGEWVVLLQDENSMHQSLKDRIVLEMRKQKPRG